MAASADYLSSLLTLAKNASAARKAAFDTALKQGVSGTFAKDAAGNTVYTPGTEGTLDVGYQRGTQNLQGSLESRGILRSGEGATKQGNLLTDYQRAALGLYGTTEANKLAEDSNYLQQEADYKMKYGTGTEATGKAPAVNTEFPSMFQPQPDGSYAPQVNEQTQAAAMALGSQMGTYADPRYMKKPIIKKPAAVAAPVRRSTVRSPISRIVS